MINPIQYLRHEQIDRARWDRTVENAPNGFIYCRSFFLDAMCKWDALVSGDYEFIMPLPNKSKWGIQYIYTPFFIGQLGVVSSMEIKEQVVNEFLKAIPKNFSYIDIQLNEQNLLGNTETGIVTEDRTNYLLDLNKPFHLIEADYTKDARKNLRQAAQYNLSVVENIDIEMVIQYFKQAYGTLNPKIDDSVYNSFTAACKAAMHEGLGFTFGLKDAGNKIVSAAFLGKDNKRIYYICGAPNEAGRSMNAQHVLIDALFKKYAGSSLLFDFEGSDFPAVANFYKKFSPEKKIYQQVKINRLPFWLKWLKG